MANYILKYKNKYRLLPELDESTGDFPRGLKGELEDIDVYIACQGGNKIKTYGHIDGKKAVWLIAYIPSIGRARNIKKELDKLGIEYIDYIENDIEADFKFKAKDVEEVAKLLKARTSGASISPFSNKNLPKAKNVEIPSGEIARYKEISARVDKGDLLIIHHITTSFLDDILQKKSKKRLGKSFDYKKDIKKKYMSRQVKEYIYTMNFWEEYLEYLNKEIESFYSSK